MLGRAIALVGGLAVPPDGLGLILGHRETFGVHPPEEFLSVRAAPFGRPADSRDSLAGQPVRFGSVLRNAGTVVEGTSPVRLGRGDGPLPPPRGSGGPPPPRRSAPQALEPQCQPPAVRRLPGQGHRTGLGRRPGRRQEHGRCPRQPARSLRALRRVAADQLGTSAAPAASRNLGRLSQVTLPSSSRAACVALQPLEDVVEEHPVRERCASHDPLAGRAAKQHANALAAAAGPCRRRCRRPWCGPGRCGRRPPDNSPRSPRPGQPVVHALDRDQGYACGP